MSERWATSSDGKGFGAELSNAGGAKVALIAGCLTALVVLPDPQDIRCRSAAINPQ